MNFFKSLFSNKGVLGINGRNVLYLKPFNPKKAIKLADNKIKSKKYLSTRGIPVPKLYQIIKDRKDLENFKANLKKYRDLLSDHIAKENDVLLNTADRLLDDSKQDDLFEKFENHEETVVGHGIHEKLHSMIHKWEEDF